MNFQSYLLEFSEVRDSDIDSITHYLDERSEDKHLMAENGYEPDQEIERTLIASDELGWYTDPVRYDFLSGSVYTAVGDSDIVFLGEENTLESEVPLIMQFGQRKDVELDI